MDNIEMEKIEASIQKVIYSKAETGFAVINVKDVNTNRVTIATGQIQGPKIGAIIEMTGYWRNHSKYGVQFKVVSSKISVPENYAGLINYLGSGFVDAVGYKSARKIVDFFGDKTLQVLENDINMLSKVPGIGPVRLANIKLEWNNQQLFNKMIRNKISSRIQNQNQ